MPDFLRVETRAGSPVVVNGIQLLPFATSLKLFIPFLHLGLVWNRPSSILLNRENGEELVIPIRDRTREIVWTLYGAVAILAAMTALVEFRKRGDR
jgi:hypothetical protein